jgi:hypothetical protein
MVGFDSTRWWHFDLMGNVYDYKQEGNLNGVDYSASSFNWNLRMNNSFKLAKFTRLQVMGIYNSPTVSAQGTRDGFMMANMALKQDFFKNAFSLTFSVRDVFGTMGHSSTIQDTGFYTYSEWDPKTPVFSLTATFRLNNFMSERRRAQNGDSDNGMDDINGGEEF